MIGGFYPRHPKACCGALPAYRSTSATPSRVLQSFPGPLFNSLFTPFEIFKRRRLHLQATLSQRLTQFEDLFRILASHGVQERLTSESQCFSIFPSAQQRIYADFRYLELKCGCVRDRLDHFVRFAIAAKSPERFCTVQSLVCLCIGSPRLGSGLSGTVPALADIAPSVDIWSRLPRLTAPRVGARGTLFANSEKHHPDLRALNIFPLISLCSDQQQRSIRCRAEEPILRVIGESG